MWWYISHLVKMSQNDFAIQEIRNILKLAEVYTYSSDGSFYYETIAALIFRDNDDS